MIQICWVDWLLKGGQLQEFVLLKILMIRIVQPLAKRIIKYTNHFCKISGLSALAGLLQNFCNFFFANNLY